MKLIYCERIVHLLTQSISYLCFFCSQPVHNNTYYLLCLKEKFFCRERQEILIIIIKFQLIIYLLLKFIFIWLLIDLYVLGLFILLKSILGFRFLYILFKGRRLDFKIFCLRYEFFPQAQWKYKVQPTFVIRIRRGFTGLQLSNCRGRVLSLPVTIPVRAL